MASVMVFTGNANPELTNQIARSLGISRISNALVDLYSDGEINIEIKLTSGEMTFSSSNQFAFPLIGTSWN